MTGEKPPTTPWENHNMVTPLSKDLLLYAINYHHVDAPQMQQRPVIPAPVRAADTGELILSTIYS